ncbi:MAG: homoserine O-acetyltransferase [Saprospiraceae bacterium]
MLQELLINQPFELECGETLPELQIAYHTYGEINAKGDNIIWICHALTANSDALDWWDGLVGEGKIFDPANYFIICANMLGSCYGATAPQSINPTTGQPYGKKFPIVTTRDMVRSHQLLQQHLGIEKIHLLIGGSMGGQQALEWAILDPKLIQNLCVLATNAQHSPWGIAFNESQRLALEADPTLYTDQPDAGKAGLIAARSIAMISYRSYMTYQQSQSEKDNKQLDDFRASSYQRYQGKKLWDRFEPFAYISLSKSMDNHNVGRGRDNVEAALQQISARTLVIGIQSDFLFPIDEQAFLAEHIPDSYFNIIDSIYGHDGFLVEAKVITEKIEQFLDGQLRSRKQVVTPGLPGSESF